MTSLLSERLDQLAPPQLPTPPSFELIHRTIKRVLDRYDSPAILPERNGERLLAEMARRIRDNDWQKVPMSFVTRVAGLAFSVAFRQSNDFLPVRQFLLEEIVASTRLGFLNPMVRVYMESFVPGANHSRALAMAFTGAKRRLGPPWRGLLESIPDLFDAEKAPGSIAAKMGAMSDPWHGLRAIGLRQPHAPGLMDAAHLAFLAGISRHLDRRDQIDRLLGWLKPDERTVRQVGAGAAINALLQPWQNRQPPKEISTLLIDRLTELYGHPRVNRHPAWNEVAPDLEATFLRWLMGADIRFLFRVLTEVERGHMWADREDFWWTMLERGLIDEVWVAFNEAGHHAAVEKFPKDARQGGRRFGRQVGEKDKSLLIMRIGNKIVVEGTYNFMVHVFDEHDSRAPKLYQEKYDVADIRSRVSVLWKQAHQGSWQSRVLMGLGR